MKLESSPRTLEKKRTDTPTDVRKERQGEANSRFSQFFERAYQVAPIARLLHSAITKISRDA
jgi:hypothetical protein